MWAMCCDLQDEGRFGVRFWWMFMGCGWRWGAGLHSTFGWTRFPQDRGSVPVSKQHAFELVNQLRRRGKRVTRERELLLRVIAQNAHLDAEEIHRLARREHPQIGLATVYRTMNLLKELDLVSTVGLGEPHNHFELCAEDHIHLVCLTCGRVVDVPAPAAVRRVAEREGFAVHRVSAEISGTCRTCTRRHIGREEEETR